MHLTKHHGLGNDFLIALDERNGCALPIDGALAIELCDRRRGIGADGLMHGAAPTTDQAADGVDVVMHLFNSDGSRAEMSGNGVRCLGQAVALARGVTEGTITVLTDAGMRPLTVAPGPSATVADIRVGMGAPLPGPHVPEPVDEFLDGRHATVDMGNPHLVIVVDDPDKVDLSSDGPWLEQQFPEGVNVEYIAAPDRATIDLRVWERGAGVTEACGTGACAAVHEAHRWDLVDDVVRVNMPGGSADVVLEADGTITLIGPATLIAEIEIPDPDEQVR